MSQLSDIGVFPINATGGTGVTPNLEVVTTAGNTTDKDVIVATAAAKTTIKKGSIVLQDITTGTQVTHQVGTRGGTGLVGWRSSSGTGALLEDIESAATNYVPYVSATGPVNIAPYKFTCTTMQVNLPVPLTDQAVFGGSVFTDYGFGGYTGMWFGGVTPGSDNFAIIGNGGSTFVNAGAQLILSANNVGSVSIIEPTNNDDCLNAAGSIGATGPSFAIRTVTTGIPLGNGDYTILCDATGALIPILLPGIGSPAPTGRIFVIKKIAGVNQVVINSSGAVTIDGQPNKVLNTINEVVRLQWDGANYWII